jgi:hypothetical protein
METPRKIGIGVVMIIPAFVLGGLVWSWFGSWTAVLILEIVMVLLYSSIVSGWPVGTFQKT